MKATVRINVTARDIRLGRRHSPCDCPLARAVHRAGYPRAVVGATYWRPRGAKNITHEVDLPPAIVNWIRAFDLRGRKAVRPFRATLTTKGKE